MIYGSVCSGIEAATSAWHPLGWKPAFFSEIEPFPRAVLSHHYPDVPLHGDFTTIKAGDYEPINLLVGGTPCQSFSVAGLRGGLDDERGNLALEFLRLAQRLRPTWVVWENVPGVLSSNGGRDFGSILGGMAELGYGWAYRVLDAQFFGVAQRRRRVFVVGHLGDWRRAAAVLFERHSLQGHPAPRREAGQGFAADTAPCLTSSGRGVERTGETRGQDPVVAVETLCVATGQAGAEIGAEIAPTLNCNHEAPYAMYQTVHTLRGEGFDASEDGTGRGTPLVPVAFAQNSRDEVRLINGDGAIAGALAAEAGMKQQTYVAQSVSLRGREGGATAELGDEVGNCLRSSGGGGDKAHVLAAMQVRRLTPVECARLQGFKDNYLDIPYRNKPAADGPKYKALGNSMAVPVMAWIGERIQMVEAIAEAQKEGAA